MRILLAILFLAQLAFAQIDTIRIMATDAADAGMYSGAYATYNYGATTVVLNGKSAGVTRRFNTWFDYASVPENFVVTVAECSLYCVTHSSTSGNVTIEVNKLTADYVEGTGNAAYKFGSSSWNNRGHGTGVGGTTISQKDSTWDSAGGDYSSPDDTVTVDANATWFAFEVENIVTDQLDDAAQYGFEFKHTNEALATSFARWATVEYTTESFRPCLYIEGFVPPQDSKDGSPPDTVYPIWDMCGYYATDYMDVWSSDVTTDTSAFEGIYKLDGACTTKIGSDMSIGNPSLFVGASSSESAGNYSAVRGIMLFSTVDVDTFKDIKLYIRMFTSVCCADNDSLFLVQPSVRCRTGPCGVNYEACVADSCNFYRCNTDVWPTSYIGYLPSPVLNWVAFDIPKENINYGDTTAFGLVTRLFPGSAPTGQNNYRTFTLADSFAYLLFYTGDKGSSGWGLKRYGLNKEAKYGGEKEGW